MGSVGHRIANTEEQNEDIDWDAEFADDPDYQALTPEQRERLLAVMEKCSPWGWRQYTAKKRRKSLMRTSIACPVWPSDRPNVVPISLPPPRKKWHRGISSITSKNPVSLPVMRMVIARISTGKACSARSYGRHGRYGVDAIIAGMIGISGRWGFPPKRSACYQPRLRLYRFIYYVSYLPAAKLSGAWKLAVHITQIKQWHHDGDRKSLHACRFRLESALA